MLIFSPIGLPWIEHSSLKCRRMTSIRSKFLSCPNELKLNIQSLLTLLITKIPCLPILNHGAMVILGSCRNFHNFGSKLTNEVFLLLGGPGGFEYSISAHLDNFEILTSKRSYADLWGCCALSLVGQFGWKLIFNLWVAPYNYGITISLIFKKIIFSAHPTNQFHI